MIRFILEGDQSPRYGIAERFALPESEFLLRETPSGAIVPAGNEVRVLAIDPHEHPRLAQSGYRFVGGLPDPSRSGSSAWVRERLARER